ncbi:AT-rich interactive domain-containing protein 4 [Rhynchospora pubera]|uniref:AT-rich interactive domain-containing protein 4 n=1 Tax=Rhynchospora pubera TaxID=906938 RepID=A0AAV8GEJ6_9POAL|nr:AT-rich interactive domain-containing protein 4 [Rhynchospora pubera]
MSTVKGLARERCSLLAVLCGNYVDRHKIEETEGTVPYPFPEIASAGRVEVHKLVNPTFDQFKEAQRSVQPIILFCQGEQLSDIEEIGSLIWGTTDASDSIASLIDPPLPTIVYLEVPNGEDIAQSLHFKGVPYVIYWKNQFSSYSASHFREALLSCVQSSLSHTWDAFQLANASFRLYCTKSNRTSRETDGQRVHIRLGPRLLGVAPKIPISTPETSKAEAEEEEEQDSSETSPVIKIYEEDVDIRLLICGLQCAQDAFLLGSLEDGLSALLNVEIRGSKLQNRVSAAPPLEAGTLNHGIVTMRCDLTTCNSTHISLLVSGGAENCFDDQLLEMHIKNELIEKSRLVRPVPSSEKSYGPQHSLTVACGAPVFEVRMAVPKWTSQVLKHLAKEASYRSLVALGIASLDGTPVASFDRRDANRLLFFCRDNKKELQNIPLNFHPLRCPSCPTEERAKRSVNPRPVSSMRPVPHSRKHKLGLYFDSEKSSNRQEQSAVNSGNKPGSVPVTIPAVKQYLVRSAPKVVHRKPLSQPVVPINPLPMKKHGCTRFPIRICSEEEFLKDVMQFLVQRGHNKLVPQGGLSEFPEAILNAKRLDLYNLYKEVVSRGGFYVGNGINWKGQVFSKMRNHTISNKMTGVGNTLKRHYETYLLEYELAHDDVDGECCLLCRSSAPGDWVNCGLCGEWAHFGCDRRQGLGTFKDYSKTDGLEYICPHCSVTSSKKRMKLSNGLSTMRTIASNA